jgi:hypothetical protein
MLNRLLRTNASSNSSSSMLQYRSDKVPVALRVRRAKDGRRLTLCFAASLVLAGAIGCGNSGTGSESFSTPGKANSDSDAVGSVSFDLAVGASEIDVVRYDISGNHFQKTGNIDVSHSPHVSAVVGAIPFGTGYTATLTAESARGVHLNCNGNANFDVTSANVTPVEVKITCQELLAAPVPFPATIALGAIFAVAGVSLLRGDRRRRSSRT